MARGKRSSRDIYKVSRTARDIEVLSSGDPKKIARRAKNKVVGRAMGKAIAKSKIFR